jgi:hypothetical protein
VSEADVRKRFRQVAIAYAIIATTVVAGLWINWSQTESIHKTQHALQHDTAELAKALAAGQAYLCHRIADLALTQRAVTVQCLSAQQRYAEIITRLESQK